MTSSPAEVAAPDAPAPTYHRNERPKLSIPVTVSLMKDGRAVLTSPIVASWRPEVRDVNGIGIAVRRLLSLCAERGIGTGGAMIPADGKDAPQLRVLPGGAGGAEAPAAASEPEVRVEVREVEKIVEVPVDRIVEKEVRVEVPVEVIREVEKIVEIAAPPPAPRELTDAEAIERARTLPPAALLGLVPYSTVMSVVSADDALTKLSPERVAAWARSLPMDQLADETLAELSTVLPQVGAVAARMISYRDRERMAAAQRARVEAATAAAEAARAAAVEAEAKLRSERRRLNGLEAGKRNTKRSIDRAQEGD